MRNITILIFFISLAWVLSGLSPLFAQQPQVEQSQAFRNEAMLRIDEERDRVSGEQGESGFGSGAPSTPGDDDLGDQLLLYEEPQYNPFEVGASFTVMHTNNVLLVDVNANDDRYTTYEGFVNYRPKFHNRLYGNFGYRHQFFHYEENGQLNFDSQTLIAGISSPIPELWNILFYANYSYNRLTYAKGNGDGDALTEFYRSHAVSAGLLKTFPLSRAHYIYLGPSGKWAMTDPFTVSRDEYTFLFGYSVDFTRWLNGSLTHQTNFHDYKSNDRDDINQVLGGAITVSPLSWLKVSVTTSYGTNNSTNEALNYEFFNIGGNVRAAYQF